MELLSENCSVDWLVIGAGAAGSVVANRLSSDPGSEVLLIDAGPDLSIHGEYPTKLLDAHNAVLSGYNWPFRAVPQGTGLGKRLGGVAKMAKGANISSSLAVARVGLRESRAINTFTYPVGRLVGGSTAINGCLAFAPNATDVNRWSLNDPHWRWEQFNHSLKRVLKNPDLTLHEWRKNDLIRTQAAFLRACNDLDWQHRDSSASDSGYRFLQRTVANGERVSAADAFLTPVRSRNNLTIHGDTEALQLRFKPGTNRVIGANCRSAGKTITINAENVVLCCGAINTPVLLLRSGIGCSKQLRTSQLDCQIDLPAVGRNLADHASVGLWGVPSAGMCRAGEDIHQSVLALDDLRDENHGALSVYMASSVETNKIPELLAAFGDKLAISLTVVLGRPRSRGHITLDPNEPFAAPSIMLNCATDEQDQSELMRGVREAWQLIQTPALQEVFSSLLVWNSRIIEDDNMLRSTIGTMVRGSWHACGTARLGNSGDPEAVLDSEGRVLGCEGLRVADASALPSLPDGPTSITCMALAEHLVTRWLDNS